MPLEEGKILVLTKRKIVDKLIDMNLIIGRRLMYYQAKYSVDDMIMTGEMDQRKVPGRFKNLFLHDQDIIDKRWAECEACEHLIKATNSCKKCGCFMKVKTKVATASCPIGKWEKEYDFIKGKKVGTPVTS